MPVTEAPPKPPSERPLRRDLPQDPAELHLLIEELEDDRERSRWRESVWISVILHLLIVMAIIIQPKFFPDLFSSKDKVVLVSQEMKDRDIEYLALPQDSQKPTPPPKSDILSDKNRVAQARRPTIDRHTLEELQNARRRGAPGPQGMQAPAPQQSAAAPPQQGQQQQPQNAAKPPENSNTVAKLESPPAAPNRNVFSSASSAGSAIEQATRAAAAGRGQGGDYGIGPLTPNTNAQGAVDILSDTLGVDFGPYLSRVLEEVRRNWYNLIPEEARSPLFKQGKLSIQFVINKNGSVEGMRLISPSGDVALDRAAWGGITASNPFPPLPREFNGPYLALRFRFYYNPDRGELR
ncbi:MAG TPA: TonB family protein [Terriglobales bacterium]|jgi:TonB family protein|nr:TonB family protein [Terriglobales bacterium]